MTKGDELKENVLKSLRVMLAYDADAALMLVTGVFVGLTIEFAKRAGQDTSCEIRIDSGGKRDITIHKEK